MKRKILLVLAFVLLLGAVACAPPLMQESAPTLEYRGVVLTANMGEQELIAALGNDFSLQEAQSCAGQGMDRLYSYPGIRLYVFAPDGGQATLASASYTDDTVRTADGLYIGCSAEQVRAARGEPTVQSATHFTYRAGGATLVFSLRDGRVTAITLSAENGGKV